MMIQGQIATLPEYKVSQELDKLEIPYQFQKAFLGGRTQTEDIVSDFYIPSYSIIISVIGTYWHASPQVRAKDLLQRTAILSQGIWTIFIKEADILKRASYYVSEALLGNDHSGLKL